MSGEADIIFIWGAQQKYLPEGDLRPPEAKLLNAAELHQALLDDPACVTRIMDGSIRIAITWVSSTLRN